MKKILIISLIILVSCSNDREESDYLRWVGDSSYDPEKDGDFQICGNENFVLQYFHLDNGIQYQGEKIELERLFNENYQAVQVNQSGWIRIRFIVNCQGMAGRFRIIGADVDYQELVFDERITDQLLAITKSLEDWVIQSKDGQPRDYYQYLIFKIYRGELVELLP